MARKTVVEEVEQNPEIVLVKAGPKLEPGKVAVWERHPDHPHADHEEYGEIFIPDGADNNPVPVALTSLVEEKIRAGLLVQVKTADPVETTRKYVSTKSDE